MPYTRKTRDEYDVEQYTAEGWEVVSCYPTFREARDCKKKYRENQPEFAVRIVKHRIPIQGATS